MRLIIAAIIITLLTAAGTGAFALPRFALMTGAKCASCHVNPTGGGIRNEYGTAYGSDKVPLESLRDSEFTFSGKLNNNITLGADYRSQFLYDAFGSDQGKATTFHAMTAAIYGDVRLTKNIDFVFKYDLVNNNYGFLSGPEVYAVARILPAHWYVKGGAFLPDYGWRLDDHTAYTRGGNLGFVGGFGLSEGLIFVPGYKDIGFEIGGTVEGINLTAGLFNGSGNLQKIDFSNDKAFVAHAEYAGSASDVNFRLGGSVYKYKTFTMGGVDGGIGCGDLALFGEADWTDNYLQINFSGGPSYGVVTGKRTFAAFGEADYRAIQGLWFTARYEVFDPDNVIHGDALKRAVLGLEFFPYPFVELRPQYRINMETPGINNDQALLQMHVWF
jgi:hypothetical protein